MSHFILKKNKHTNPKMPAKKKASQPPPRKVVKADFFVHPCYQQFETLVSVDKKEEPESTSQSFPPQREQRRFFICNKETGEPYAEWINNVAISLETGEELFKSRNYYEESEKQLSYKDYSVPTYYREDDPTIYTVDLIAAGIITEQDLAVGNGALTKQKYEQWKAFKSRAP